MKSKVTGAKLISFLLALTMTAGMLPMSAFASRIDATTIISEVITVSDEEKPIVPDTIAVPDKADTQPESSSSIAGDTKSSGTDSLFLSSVNAEYGYASLSTVEQQVYDALEKIVKSGDESVDIGEELSVTVDMLRETVEMFVADHPEYFWFLGTYRYAYDSLTNIVLGIFPIYELNGEEIDADQIADANKIFTEKLDEIIADLNQKTAQDSDYLRALWLHDKVTTLISYGYGANHQSAYGALIDGEAVCAGYARLYQCLLNRAGVRAWTVKGESVNPSTAMTEAHAWTLMWLDNHCVYSDATWDDQDKDLYHIYFARDLDTMSTEHMPDAAYADKLPAGDEGECNHYGYFEVVHPENTISSTITAADIAPLLKPGKDGKTWTAEIFDPSGVNFKNWFSDSDNLRELISQALEPGSYKFKASNLGNTAQGMEIHLTIQSVVVDPDITAAVNSDDNTYCVTIDFGTANITKTTSLAMAFYDKNGKFISTAMKEVSIDQTVYSHVIPNQAATCKAMLMEMGSVLPLCAPETCGVE